mmetsp:Transcript_5555/g.6287  ORF Transcript_5555/g.6287 Transcript_5555/m.6287 type:complete len:112 (+) Transcript_5555:756-1091(+)
MLEIIAHASTAAVNQCNVPSIQKGGSRKQSLLLYISSIEKNTTLPKAAITTKIRKTVCIFFLNPNTLKNLIVHIEINKKASELSASKVNINIWYLRHDPLSSSSDKSGIEV